jgi:hypothetical protein
MASLAPDAAIPAPAIEFHTSKGNSKFEHYVSSTWTTARRFGVPGAAGPIDHLVCVVDADKLRDNVLPTLPAIPRNASDVPRWHAEAQGQWQSMVRSWVDSSVPADSVHGFVLRWSRESALLAGFDRPPFRDVLGLDIERPELKQFLQKECVPSPTSIPNGAAFSDAFGTPYTCLKRMFDKQGLHLPSKNDTSLEDVLRALAKDHADVVCSRVPDFDALARLVWALPSPDAQATATPPAEAKPRKRRKPRR